MPPLDGAIGGRMVGGSEPDGDVERRHDILPEVGNKGIAIVAEDQTGKAKPGRPLHESLAALHTGCGLHFVAFQPPGSPVQASQKILETF